MQLACLLLGLHACMPNNYTYAAVHAVHVASSATKHQEERPAQPTSVAGSLCLEPHLVL